MRTLFILLILSNIAYAGWVYLNPVKQYTVPSLPEGLKTLVLLKDTERDADPLPGATEQPEGAATDGGLEAGDGAIDAVHLEVSGSDGVLPGKTASTDLQPVCYTLGPFKDKLIMQQLRDSLSEEVGEVSVRQRTEAEKHRYWVYAPAKNRRKARELAQNLRDKKVKDFYIVLKGVRKNNVSLGHFRESKHASRRVKKLNGLGFDARVDVIYRDFEVYWLDYALSGEKASENFRIGEYITDGVSQISRQCEL